tara:strand:+ start:870 stop:1103 length:234 start_codon:yes stop_codon:yes gene_type:complete
MLEFKKREIKNSRTEQLSKYQNELKQQKSFDKSLCNQKERISSTGKSHVRSFQKINERRKWEWELELENILKELDND